MASCTCANPDAVVKAINSHSDARDNNLDRLMRTLIGENMGNDENHSNNGTVSSDESAEQAIASLRGGEGDTGGKEGYGFAPIRFSNWAAPEISDAGEGAWSNLWQAAATAIALYNAKIQGDINKEQMNLANQYYDMAKYKLDRFMKNYKPLEEKLLRETRTTPVRELDCDDDRKRSKASVDSAFSSLSEYASRQAKKLRVCVDKSMLGMMAYRQNMMLADTENYNLLDDQFYTDYKNDQRWNRRSNVLNLGRNMGAQALSYGDVARTLMGNLSGQLDKITGSLMTAVGYFGARNDTYYPNTFLSSYGGMNNNLVSTGLSANQLQPGTIGAGV